MPNILPTTVARTRTTAGSRRNSQNGPIRNPVSRRFDALYKAYFVEGRNLAKEEVLLEIARSVGLPVEEARSVLENRSSKDAVDADWQKARRYGVTGVPTFVAGGSKVVGAQPYEVLVQQVRAAGAHDRTAG